MKGDGNIESGSGDVNTFGEEGSQQQTGDFSDNSNNGDRFSDDVVLELGDNSLVGNVVLETVVTGKPTLLVYNEDGLSTRKPN